MFFFFLISFSVEDESNVPMQKNGRKKRSKTQQTNDEPRHERMEANRADVDELFDRAAGLP